VVYLIEPQRFWAAVSTAVIFGVGAAITEVTDNKVAPKTPGLSRDFHNIFDISLLLTPL